MSSPQRRSGRIASIESEKARWLTSRQRRAPSKPRSREGCIHPANVWLKDSRPSAHIPSRSAILRKLIFENVVMNELFRTVLDSYVSGDDPKLLAQEEEENNKAAFPNFMLLPPEIRRVIWQLSVPHRALDVRDISWPSYIDTPYPRLPVPHIARVCREARDAVLRMGTRLALYEDFNGPKSDSAYDSKHHPAGFVTTKDTLCYMIGSYGGVDGMIKEGRCDADNMKLLCPRDVLQELNATDVAVRWPDPHTEYLIQGPSGQNEYFLKKLTRWRFLTKCPSLKRIYVETQSHYSLPAYFTLMLKAQCTIADRSLMYLWIDLYDDQALAEIVSLETANPDDNLPRYLARTGAYPWGPCFNCEREIWERDHKSAVESFWLHLHEDELGDTERRSVFPPGQPYNPDHPWVREKLSKAPEFRPIARICIQSSDIDAPQLEDEEDYESEEEESAGDDAEDDDYEE